MKSKKEKLYFVPGNEGKDCPGRETFIDEDGKLFELCCDECDYFKCCEKDACKNCNLSVCLKEYAKYDELA